MNLTSQIFRFAAVWLVLTLAACGGGGGDGGGGTPPMTTVVGAAGGTVLGPNGAKVVIPPGALAADTTITIEQTSAGAAPLPAGFNSVGQMFAFTPHGITFAVPVTVTLPFDPTSVPAGQVPGLFKTNAQNQWEQVAGAAFGVTTVTAQISSFSFAQAAVPPLTPSPKVGREWSFKELRADGSEATLPPPDGAGTQEGAAFQRTVTFGSTSFDSGLVLLDGATLAANGIANGVAGASEDGMTLYVGAEAPAGIANLPSAPIGARGRLVQVQTFVKRADSARLTFTMPRAFIEVTDGNAALQRVCPPAHGGGDGPCALISGQLHFDLEAIDTSPDPVTFYRLAGGAILDGFAESWENGAWTEAVSQVPLWATEDFGVLIENLNGAVESHVLMSLAVPRSYSVDLSSIAVGRAFHVRITAEAYAHNFIAGPPSEFATSAAAYLNLSPQSPPAPILSHSGLEQISTPSPLVTSGVPVVPTCVPGPGPNPAAGVLQFSGSGYSQLESSTRPVIVVTRTGGSSGAVSATFTTSDGTAIGATDYTPVNATVHFADGDATPRLVTVPITGDRIHETAETVNLTLSQPGGCAALGAQTTAVLTIRDDDLASALPSGLDPSFGIAGKATLERFGGARSSMALQADGKIVMVGGTFTDFVLARFNADGSLDTGFGIDGKVATDMGSGLRQEEALGVAIQSDGKIVVVGYAAIPTTPPAPRLPDTFALARYHPDGNLDTSFGSGGRVSGNVNGHAHAVAIQPDGKIVVAGEFSFASSSGTDFSDITLARFNPNGTLDLGFGGSGTGQVATDIGGVTNTARNLVLQPNGAVVVSGKPQGSQPGFDHTDIVRYDPNGTPDTSFGNAGKLTLAGVDVGQGLVRQPDGKLVLVGSVTVGTFPASSTRFALMRLADNGSLDPSFGNAGTVDTAFAVSAGAFAVALQTDGKIVAAGSTVLAVNPNFMVARYNTDGSIDPGFGIDGVLSIDFFGFGDGAESVLLQPDGKIVVGGVATNQFSGYGLARINP